jgi:hypothetical protein
VIALCVQSYSQSQQPRETADEYESNNHREPGWLVHGSGRVCWRSRTDHSRADPQKTRQLLGKTQGWWEFLPDRSQSSERWRGSNGHRIATCDDAALDDEGPELEKCGDIQLQFSSGAWMGLIGGGGIRVPADCPLRSLATGAEYELVGSDEG